MMYKELGLTDVTKVNLERLVIYVRMVMVMDWKQR